MTLGGVEEQQERNIPLAAKSQIVSPATGTERKSVKERLGAKAVIETTQQSQVGKEDKELEEGEIEGLYISMYSDLATRNQEQQNQNLHSLLSNGFGVGLLERRLCKFWFCCSGFVLQDHCNLLYSCHKYISGQSTFEPT